METVMAACSLRVRESGLNGREGMMDENGENEWTHRRGKKSVVVVVCGCVAGCRLLVVEWREKKGCFADFCARTNVLPLRKVMSFPCPSVSPSVLPVPQTK